MEIFQDTIIQSICRQGADSDRLVIRLKSGELGYTTDTERLFVGNGTLSGGNLIGNLFKGITTDITLMSPSEVGDYTFNSDNNSLYILKTKEGSSLNDWEKVGGVYSALSPITISSDNEVSLEPLSANSVDPDLIEFPLIINSGRIGLSATIPFHIVSTNSITLSSGLKSYVDGVDNTGTAINPLSSSVIIQSNELYAKYNGLSGQTLEYSKFITSVDRLSAGDYVFNYAALPTANIIPMCQLYGVDSIGYQPRVMSVTTTTCNVHVLSSDLSKHDANLFITITY